MRLLTVSAVVIVLAAAWTPLAQAAPAGAAACSGCHPAAAGVVSPVPRLIGLERADIVKAMQEFRSGKRPATVMDRIAKGYTDDEIQAIADWYASQR